VAVDWCFKRDAGSDLDSGFGEPVELGWIVGEQGDPLAVQSISAATP